MFTRISITGCLNDDRTTDTEVEKSRIDVVLIGKDTQYHLNSAFSKEFLIPDLIEMHASLKNNSLLLT